MPTAGGAKILAEILELLALVTDADRSWLVSSLRATLRSGSANGSSRAHEPGSYAPGSLEAHAQDSFSKFWVEYPRKNDRLDALRIWQKISPDSELQAAILAGLRRAKGQWLREGREPKYIPYAKTWLYGRCWQNEPLAAPVLKADEPEREPAKCACGEPVLINGLCRRCYENQPVAP